MVFVEGDDYRQLRRPGDDPAQFRSVVRPAQVATTPDSLVHQYRSENFTPTQWSDSIGNADMSVTGLSQQTRNGEEIIRSDGVDDIGKADGPQLLAGSDSFAVAVSFNSSDQTDGTVLLGATSGSSAFEIVDADFFDGSNGEVVLNLADSNSDQLVLESQSVFFDGSSHVLIWNKRGNTPQDIELYVDSMTSPVTLITQQSTGFDSTAFNSSADMGFFASNDSGTGVDFKSADMRQIEFFTEPLSEEERIVVKNRVVF
jgi:hypothetical protein